MVIATTLAQINYRLSKPTSKECRWVHFFAEIAKSDIVFERICALQAKLPLSSPIGELRLEKLKLTNKPIDASAVPALFTILTLGISTPLNEFTHPAVNDTSSFQASAADFRSTVPFLFGAFYFPNDSMPFTFQNIIFNKLRDLKLPATFIPLILKSLESKDPYEVNGAVLSARLVPSNAYLKPILSIVPKLYVDNNIDPTDPLENICATIVDLVRKGIDCSIAVDTLAFVLNEIIDNQWYSTQFAALEALGEIGNRSAKAVIRDFAPKIGEESGLTPQIVESIKRRLRYISERAAKSDLRFSRFIRIFGNTRPQLWQVLLKDAETIERDDEKTHKILKIAVPLINEIEPIGGELYAYCHNILDNLRTQ